LQQRKADWKDRSHFYTFAARVMRMILMDHARGVSAQKRGASAEHVPLSPDLPWIDVGSSEMITLNSALDELNKVDPDMVRLVELRYFLGCTADEVADIHQISKATVNRNLKLAKSWLYRYLRPDAGGGAAPP